MAKQHKLRGHNIVYVGDRWLYEDTMTPSAGYERPCGYCGKENTSEGHDGCLGTIPKAMNACCGHGENEDSYIQYFDKSIIRGVEALNEIAKIRCLQGRVALSGLKNIL